MKWVRSKNGSLTNMAMCATVGVVTGSSTDGAYDLTAFDYNSHIQYTLMSGTKAECEAALDRLAEKMNAMDVAPKKEPPAAVEKTPESPVSRDEPNYRIKAGYAIAGFRYRVVRDGMRVVPTGGVDADGNILCANLDSTSQYLVWVPANDELEWLYGETSLDDILKANKAGKGNCAKSTWTIAVKVIASFLREYETSARQGSYDDAAAMLIARLSHHNFPIILDMKPGEKG